MVRVRRRFDHFMIIRQIGEGGMSRVFEAEDETLGRRVALKILNRTYSRDAVRLEQFRQEALITANITHAHVIKLYSVGYDQGYFYLAMELVGGGSLEQRIRREGKLSEGEALSIGHEVAEGLRAAQHQGLIHRDVKPANILFTETGTAKVVDFGLALFVNRGPDQSVEIWATPYYVAPEKVIENREDYRSDIFSLGATLFHALTGTPPHQSDTYSLESLRQIKQRRVSLEDSGLRFSARTQHVVNAMLSYKPENRFANYDEVVEELRLADGLLNQSGIRRRLISRRARLIGSVAAAIMLAFLIGWLLGEGSQRTTKVSVTKVTTADSTSLEGEVVTPKDGKTVAERFLEAREQMLRGGFESARDDFKKIARNKETRQLTECWALFNAALCEIMLGNRDQAAKVFKDLEVGGAETETSFFKLIGGRMKSNLALGTALTQLNYDTNNEALIGYLAHGLAELHFGDEKLGAETVQFFKTHQAKLKPTPSTTTTASPEWVKYYTVLVDLYQADIAEFQLASDALQKLPRTIASENAAALKALEEKGKKLKTEAFRVRLNQLIAGLKQDISTIKLAELVKQHKEQELRRKKDLEQFSQLNQLIASLSQSYDYSHVIEMLGGKTFDTEEVRSALESRVYLYTQARDFIHQLNADLSTKGWSGKLTRRSGSTLAGTVTAASGAAMLDIKVDGGTLSVPLDSITPESLIEMAQSFTAQITDSTDYFHRMELAAVFAHVAGLTQLSTTLATQLTEENRSFRMRWTKVMLESGI